MDLKIADVAELLSVSEAKVEKWIKVGKIPAYQLVPHEYRFGRLEIEEWVHSEEGLTLFAEEEISPSVLQRGAHGMRQFSLYRAVNKGGVFSDISGRTKEELIRGAMQRLAPTLNLDAEVLSDLLIDRENLMPTALNHGIGVPHARDFILSQPFDLVTVVFPQEPLAYGALDGQPVHTLFFLFASNDKNHLNLLAKLAHLASHAAAVDFFRSRPDQRELLEYLKEWESRLGLKLSNPY